MLFTTRSIEAPNRYARHLPAGIPSTKLEDAANALEKQFGPPTLSAVDSDLVELHHKLEDRDVWFYRHGFTLVGIRSMPKPKMQAFWRPCSGFGGSLTGFGSATGFALLLQQLIILATGTAQLFYYGALPGACVVCAPCICVPIGPYTSAISVVPAGFLRVTVTVDVTGQLFCI